MKAFRWIWEFPQCLLAKILIFFYKAERITPYKKIECYRSKRMCGAISLGLYIITDPWYDENRIKHEYGHTRQSALLGPLYLIIIGLPCVCWIGLRSISKWAKSKSYYWFYTERWADTIGGVLRNK